MNVQFCVHSLARYIGLPPGRVFFRYENGFHIRLSNFGARPRTVDGWPAAGRREIEPLVSMDSPPSSRPLSRRALFAAGAVGVVAAACGGSSKPAANGVSPTP